MLFRSAEILLAPIVKMEIGKDELNDVVIKAMHTRKDKISVIIKEYCDIPI